jgi:hypothetical protein
VTFEVLRAALLQSGLLLRDVLSLGKQFLTFHSITVPPPWQSSSTIIMFICKDEGTAILHNTGNYSTNDTVSHPRRLEPHAVMGT